MVPTHENNAELKVFKRWTLTVACTRFDLKRCVYQMFFILSSIVTLKDLKGKLKGFEFNIVGTTLASRKSISTPIISDNILRWCYGDRFQVSKEERGVHHSAKEKL